jgi:hypothetical protein
MKKDITILVLVVVVAVLVTKVFWCGVPCNPPVKQEKNNPPVKQEKNNPPVKQEKDNPPVKQEKNNPPVKQEKDNPPVKQEVGQGIYVNPTIPINADVDPELLDMDKNSNHEAMMLLNTTFREISPDVVIVYPGGEGSGGSGGGCGEGKGSRP